MIRVGICGIGFMGKMHYGVWSQIPDAQVVAIADPSEIKRKGDWKAISGNIPGKTQDIIDLSQTRTYEDYSGVTDDPDIDVVDITLPTFLHHEAAVRALKNKKHVFLEKPIARNLKLADAIVAAAKKSKTKMMIGHCIRLWPEYAMLKEWNKTKKLGKLLSAVFRRVSPLPVYTTNSWILDGKLSGGAALDLHIHDTDFVNYLLGKPQAVSSTGTVDKKQGPVHIVTQYLYKDKVSITAEGGWNFPAGFPFEMSFVVNFARAVVEYNCNKTPALVVYHEGGKKEVPEVKPATGYSEEIAYFADCIKKGKNPAIATVTDARDSLKIIEAEVKSLTSGKIVSIR